MSLFRTKKTKVMLIIFGLFIQQSTNPGTSSVVGGGGGRSLRCLLVRIYWFSLVSIYQTDIT